MSNLIMALGAIATCITALYNYLTEKTQIKETTQIERNTNETKI